MERGRLERGRTKGRLCDACMDAVKGQKRKKEASVNLGYSLHSLSPSYTIQWEATDGKDKSLATRIRSESTNLRRTRHDTISE